MLNKGWGLLAIGVISLFFWTSIFSTNVTADAAVCTPVKIKGIGLATSHTSCNDAVRLATTSATFFCKYILHQTPCNPIGLCSSYPGDYPSKPVTSFCAVSYNQIGEIYEYNATAVVECSKECHSIQ